MHIIKPRKRKFAFFPQSACPSARELPSFLNIRDHQSSSLTRTDSTAPHDIDKRKFAGQRRRRGAERREIVGEVHIEKRR